MIRLDIIGHLGQDAKQNEVGGNYVINFSVAHTDSWTDTDTGEVKEKTTWVSCAMWSSKPNDVVNYMKKGRLVFVSGKPKVKTWQNNDGRTMAGIEVDVKNLELHGKNEPEEKKDEPAKQEKEEETK